MKKLLFVLLLTFITINSLHSQTWETDISEAKEIASKENKPIILVFQGSDWCAPCMKLEKEIWSTNEFKGYAKEHFVMLKADFPKRSKNALPKEQQDRNNALAEKYNKNGYFPFVVVLNSKGEVKGTTGYKKMQPKQFEELLSSFN